MKKRRNSVHNHLLTRAYSSREVLDPNSLALHAGYTCWILYVDTLVIEVGGKNLKIKERTKKWRRMKILKKSSPCSKWASYVQSG